MSCTQRRISLAYRALTMRGSFAGACVCVRVKISAFVRIAVESVLMWDQPVTSGLALASITAAFFLLEKSGFTLIALTANLLLVAVLGVFVWSNVATVLNLYVFPRKNALTLSRRECCCCLKEDGCFLFDIQGFGDTDETTACRTHLCVFCICTRVSI